MVIASSTAASRRTGGNWFYQCINCDVEEFEYYPMIPLYEPVGSVHWPFQKEEAEESVPTFVPPPRPEKTAMQLAMQDVVGDSDPITISDSDALRVAHKLGYSPDHSDAATLRQSLSSTKRGVAAEVERWLATCRHPEDSPHHLTEFFRKRCDKYATGELPIEHARYVLGNFGDALSDAEIDALFSKLSLDKRVEYTPVSQRLLQN